jgi:hypothetical protein
MKDEIIDNFNYEENINYEQLNSKFNIMSTPSKYNYSPINNLYEDFSKNILNSKIKNISFENLITLSTSNKKKVNITNESIIDEMKNKLYQYNQILNFKINQNEYFHKEFQNFKNIYKNYFQSLTNFNIENYHKLLKDFELIKISYEQNLKKNSDFEEWEILEHSINNFSEFLHNSLDNVNYQLDLDGIMQKIIDLSNYIQFDEKDNNINLNEDDDNLLYNKINFDFGNENLGNINPFKRNNVLYIKDKKGNITQNCFSLKKIDKINKTSKIIKIIIYIDNKENINFVKSIINLFKNSFSTYIIYYFEKIQLFSSFKIHFIGKCKSIPKIKKLINEIINQSKYKIIIKQFYYNSLKEIIMKIIHKLKNNNANYFYTTNIKKNILNKLYNKNY